MTTTKTMKAIRDLQPGDVIVVNDRTEVVRVVTKIGAPAGWRVVKTVRTEKGKPHRVTREFLPEDRIALA
jgi:hypothetical protein